MPKHLTQETKEKIIVKHEQGLKAPVIAEHLMISERSVYKAINQYRNGEDLKPKTTNGGRTASYNEEQKQIIVNSIAEQPDIALRKLIEKAGLEIVESTMSRILKKLGYKRKKGIYVR